MVVNLVALVVLVTSCDCANDMHQYKQDSSLSSSQRGFSNRTCPASLVGPVYSERLKKMNRHAFYHHVPKRLPNCPQTLVACEDSAAKMWQARRLAVSNLGKGCCIGIMHKVRECSLTMQY